MQQLFILLLILSNSSGQVPAPTTVAAPAPNATSAPTAACNPFIQMCPGANCTTNNQGNAYIAVSSPNASVYFYTGTPVLVNWTYSADTDRAQFPAKSVSIYYQSATVTRTWTLWTTVPAANTTFIGTIPNAPANSYNLRIVADNVDPTGLSGTPASCFNTGFPRMGIASFRLLVSNQIPVAKSNPFPPNTATNAAFEPASPVSTSMAAILLPLLAALGTIGYLSFV
ncbi:expressed protein [Batrachochytrium dendrobatidis JAM81]|uniref:Expressed protein n=1 Tax=Batrachochytrium dendrobatidis (strain JAM81 / FGSC 10211) TaxID=684364 RepID=F4NWT0_BATDJ|nr:uncharacterized protein BATDEDRAFT_32922 [Batrachochytrium dendrobatidis JAM81]EGF82875.1 expressed protein [Batrachochytrium dendrobatidis JAM81]|eukprot:XP_006676758.1 expressed protein [Batrachochytrium dendrobatidis JAM81]